MKWMELIRTVASIISATAATLALYFILHARWRQGFGTKS
jgi:hypothetical protein